jgi:uncharacterized integral membrane protein (TIGR00697 family)
LDRRQHLYLWLAGLFVAALLTADLIGGKIAQVGGRDLSVGLLAFPITFLLTDILNEFYGPAGARRVTYVGLGAVLFAYAVINVARLLPTSPASPLEGQTFATVFGLSGRLIIASLTAYVIGQLLDISLFAFLRRMTKHRLLWLRATGSTVGSQLVDTFVVTFGLMVGRQPLTYILELVRNQYLFKLVLAICLTPLIYGVHRFLLRVIKIKEPPESAFAATEGNPLR